MITMLMGGGVQGRGVLGGSPPPGGACMGGRMHACAGVLHDVHVHTSEVHTQRLGRQGGPSRGCLEL